MTPVDAASGVLVSPVVSPHDARLSSTNTDDTTTDVKDRVTAYMNGAGISDQKTYSVDVDTTAVATAAGTFNACVVYVELTQPLPSLSVIGKLTGGAFGNVPVRANAVMRTEAQAAN